MSYWNKNLSLLEQKNPSMARYMSGIKNPEHISVVESESGFPTLKTVSRKGGGDFLISPKNPESEAQQLLSKITFNGEDGTLLFGFGLGYLAREILRKKNPNHILYIVEGVSELFKLAMIYSDLSDILSDNNIYLFVGDAIHTILDHFVPIQMKCITGNVNRLAMPSLRRLCNEHYDALDRQIDDYITFLKRSVASFEAGKDIRLANIFQNIPVMLNSYPADTLKDSIKNNPAIIVAAGPSLKKDIESLGNRTKDSMIFCVDAALKPLLKNGIKPDCVMTCDPYPGNYNKVDGLSKEILQDFPLIYQGEALPRLIDRFSGPKFIVNANNSLTSWVTNIGRSIATFPIFPSVSHFGFLMARYMGADPIIFVGLDLSFPVDQEHADGCAHTWRVDFNNTEFIWIPNNAGGKVKTISDFLPMIHSFEYEIKKTKAQCINVSEDGAMIKGAEWMPLAEAVKWVKRNQINGQGEETYSNCMELKNDNFSADDLLSFEKIMADVSITDPDRLKDRYSDALSWMLSEIEELRGICLDAKAILGGLKQGYQKPIENSNDMERLKMTYASAFEHNDLLNVLTDYLPGYMMSRYRYQTKGAAVDNVSSIMADWEQINVFFEELSEVLPLLERHCRLTLDYIQ